MKVLDLFSGIGGFSLAAHRAGFKVVAHCEIEPFPQSVLKYRFPNIPIFEDVKTLTKELFYEKTGLKKIDIVCGGSPCQDLSVAGLQRGVVGGTRSGLFYEQIRIAKELGAKFIVWENVPGALSSNKGRDFERILCGFTGHDSIDFDKWGTAGVFRARTESDFSVCYRILDTRFFGVPQRRRRIFLVGSLGDESCAEILFEPQSLRGNPSASEESRKGSAAFAQGGFGGYYETPVGGTLTKSSGSCSGGSETLILNEVSQNASKLSPTLTASMSHIYNKQTPILFENHSQDCRYNEKEVSPTITSRSGTGGNNLPLIVKQHNYGEVRVSDVVPTLNSQSGAGRIPMAVSIRENIINRQDHNGGNGVGAIEENCYTLNASGVHAVATRSAVRRLTPLECERLQGFPDNWTRIPYRGKSADNCPDSPRYKACGNAITVAVGEWVLRRLAKEGEVQNEIQ